MKKIAYIMLAATLVAWGCGQQAEQAETTETESVEAVADEEKAPKEDAEWEQLFDGKSLEDWTHVGDGEFVIEDGMLKTTGGMGLLWYNGRKIEKSVIKVVYMSPEGRNSGVYIRIPEEPTEPWMPVNKGYEVQIDDRLDDYHITGVLYSLTKAKAKPSKSGEWNTMEITIDGPRTVVHVNGELVTDFTEGDEVPDKKEDYEPDRGPRPESGYFGLQNHADEDLVYFKEVSVKPLD
ncbi:MAG: DUF1080 domain-containing protein [Cyclobacteriaceae bacterium]|nr:DUF1080 domain-containing protein [Cyclobacteriaceae bacterium]